MGRGQVSNQSGTIWYPVITASSYKVAVLIMSLIKYEHASTQTPHKTTQTPHKRSPGKGLQSLITLFLVLRRCHTLMF